MRSIRAGRKPLVGLILLIAATFVLAACGGDDDELASSGSRCSGSGRGSG